ARLQFHVAEVVAGHGLDILWAARTETTLGFDLEAATVASLEAEQAVLEAGQQAAVTHLESCRGLALGGIYHITIGQLEGEVQGHFGIVVDADVSHVWFSNISVAGRRPG